METQKTMEEEKLKTLKEMDCVHCNDKCDGFKCDAYTIHESHAVTEEVLKQEAIKWVKAWKKTIESDIVKCPISPEYEDARIAVYNECSFAIKWAKHFFNLTEEDLK